MLSKKFIEHLESLLSEKIIASTPLSGGDINSVYLLGTSTKKVVLKTNTTIQLQDMFLLEKKGLESLRLSNTFRIPEVFYVGKYIGIAFLIIEYIDSVEKTKDFWTIFGEQLAGLHQQTTPYFGLEYDNYIGSLPQYNTICSTAADFYISQRLQPQFTLASENGFSFRNLDVFYKNIEKEIPDEPSSLIHGDLWSGNFVVDTRGLPCLIDPAIAYAPREMDIAMMHLFSGFDYRLFDVYNEYFPLQNGWSNRIPLFQLYFVLVHLNLFGSSYLSTVNSVIKKYL